MVMYPIFEPGQRVFSSNGNDWDTLNSDVWVGYVIRSDEEVF